LWPFAEEWRRRGWSLQEYPAMIKGSTVLRQAMVEAFTGA